jgi:shikimate dehydrogenase
MSETVPVSPYPILAKDRPTFYFIGVTTTKSSIMKVFPLWVKELGHPEITIEGIDLKIHDTPHAYRAAVAQIKYDPLSLGGLELSSISKRGGRLEGHAKDPITAGLSLDAIIGDNYFGRTGASVLCFGAGGSAAATLLHLMDKPDPGDRPRKFIVVNRSPGRLAELRAMVERHGTDISVDYRCNADPQVNDEWMAALPEYSIVINATGMGKDIPGSPLTNAGVFPRHGIAWEFNYRGELDFMHQALAQVDSREVKVEDGWLYFLHGWTQVVAQVLHIDLTPEVFQRLAAAAGTVR